MPLGTLLSDFERGQITELANANVSVSEIARRLERSRTEIKNYLDNPAGYGKNHGGGRRRSLSERDERAVYRAASNSSSTLRKIAANAGVNASKWTIMRTIQRNPSINRVKKLTRPQLTQEYKQSRLDWAQQRIADRTDWTNVIFSDEKKFNLDGPDGYSYYWHDLRKLPEERMSRVVGGGGVMIWACMGYGHVRWTEVRGRLNAVRYQQEVLDVHLIPFGEQLGGPNWIFQQDNATIHTAAANTDAFRAGIPRTIGHPARSADLNPIENLWGIIVQDVYANGRQFDSLGSLRDAIDTAFNRVNMIAVQKLIDSMPNRLFKLVSLRGAYTGY
jgi:hypothetical protein